MPCDEDRVDSLPLPLQQGERERVDLAFVGHTAGYEIAGLQQPSIWVFVHRVVKIVWNAADFGAPGKMLHLRRYVKGGGGGDGA